MPWGRFDDSYPNHRKVRPLSDAAFRLDVSAILWSNANLTDGKIQTDELDVVSDVRTPKKAAGELVRRGRWEATDEGWLIHDFHDYNPTAEKVREDRAAAAERQRKAREAAKARKESQAQSHSESRRDVPRESHSESQVQFAPPDPTRTRPQELPTTEPSSSSETYPPDNNHDDNHDQQADQLLDDTGPWTPALRADLHSHVAEALTDFEPAGIKAALADYRTKLGDDRTRPGLLPYLIQQHAARLEPAKATRPPWCGNCEEATRLVLDENRDPVGPCPDCRPLTRVPGSPVASEGAPT